ncbi:MAG: alcohol dehydrogenase catalytic domain-containing protein, partial [Syntrophorhabdaceae bacterium]
QRGVIMSVETSVVIRTFNEQKHLPALLDTLKLQEYQDFEVLVVDSGSIDRTREIAAQRGVNVVRIDQRDFTFGYSLNVGVRESQGRFVALVSAHTLPLDGKWLERLIEPLREDRVAMVYGRQKGNTLTKLSESRDFERIFGQKRLVMKPPRFFANNANSAVRKDLWEQHQFDQTLPGLEDIEWAKYWMEREYNVVYAPEAALFHIHEENWRQIRHRYYREAVAARWIGIKQKRNAVYDTLSEIAHLIGDIWTALSKPEKFRIIHESILFRANKAYGNADGILKTLRWQSPSGRDALFFDRVCKAVVIEGPGKAVITDAQVPELKPGDVLIRTAVTAICGTDLEIIDGTLSYFQNGMSSYPIIPGHEFSGTVVSIGSNVKEVQEGDRVVVECIQSCGICPQCQKGNFIACPDRTEVGVLRRNGAYCEYVVMPARFVHVIPREMDLRSAALCEPLAVSIKGLRRLGIWPANPVGMARSCAVVGAGPLGHLCARLLDYLGHSVTVFDHDERRLKFFENSRIRVNRNLQSGLAGQELLLEVTGDPDALQSMFIHSDPGATILLLGLPYARRPFSFESIVAYDKRVVGSVGSAREDFVDAIQVVQKMDLSFLTNNSFELDRYAEAWARFRSHDLLKALIVFTPEEGNWK